MSPSEFVVAIRDELLDANLARYREFLESSGSGRNGPDMRWPRFRDIYDHLTDEQKEDAMRLLRLVIVDTLAGVMGVLDGVAPLRNHREEFVLRYGTDTEQLNGDLLDLFLASEAP